jgi:hypothetical protein
VSGAQDLLLGNFSTAAAGYQIERSLRFNSADSAYLNRTPASAGNRKTWTWSGWVKRSGLGTAQIFWSSGTSNLETAFYFVSTDKLSIYQFNYPSYEINLGTTQVFRDVGAWYHIVIAVDTTQATSSNRVKLYVNGVQVTAFDTSTYPTLDLLTATNNNVSHMIGRSVDATGYYFPGYLTEVNFIDGQALTPSSFGQTNANTGVWEPIAYTGTYGTNGFYINFSDNSNTTSTTLGKDYSGNGNNWTPNNFSVTAGAGNDSLVDTPTPYGTDTGAGGEVRGNYGTLNPLNQTGASLTNGNLQFTKSGAASTLYTIHPTFFVSSGKWYFEMTPTAINSAGSLVGIVGADVALTTYASLASMTGNIWAWRQDAFKVNNGSSSSYGNTWTTNDVIGVAVDMDNGKIWWSKNGTWQASGDPAAGTNAAFTNVSGSVGPLLIDQGISGTFDGSINAGQRPFSYTPPSGYRSLCTTNLSTPAIGTSSTTQANDYFNTVLYNGTGATLGVTGVGFQPDFVWIKSRSAATDHALYDIVRGDKNQLESNTTTAETNETTGLTQFNADGFTVGSLAQVNTNSATYVSWNWKAGGTGVPNTTGSISSTVSANTDAGFSVVTYTGNGSTGTVGHGCKVNNVATAPSMIIVKVRSTTNDWGVGHASVGWSQAALLNLTNAFGASSYFNSTAPTSTVFSVGNNSVTNASSATYVAYCFAEVPGYSAFGSYTGNGSSDGVFVYLGFRARYLMLKSSSGTGGWVLLDTARDPYNDVDNYLYADSSAANAGSSNVLDINSNGFKIRNSWTDINGNGSTYIYAAFAESPFKYANAR